MITFKMIVAYLLYLMLWRAKRTLYLLVWWAHFTPQHAAHIIDRFRTRLFHLSTGRQTEPIHTRRFTLHGKNYNTSQNVSLGCKKIKQIYMEKIFLSRQTSVITGQNFAFFRNIFLADSWKLFITESLIINICGNEINIWSKDTVFTEINAPGA